MRKGQLTIVLLTTFLAFCTLYTPQPILPQLALDFGVEDSSAALLVTLTLIPLGLAPIFYGYFLQAIPARTMLRVSIALLVLDQVLLFLSVEFWQLMVLRAVQGFILPGVFTSLMTYCATMSEKQRIHSVMGAYIAATIIGGVSSRILSGYLSATFGWQWVFLILGLLLLIPLYLVGKIDADAKINFSRLDAKAIGRVITIPEFRYAYLTLMIMFFVFAGVLALIPFYLKVLSPNVSSLAISFIYFGYILGIPIAAGSSDITRRFGGVKNILLVSLAFTLVGFGLAQIPNPVVMFFMMTILASGFFLVHSVLSGYVNEIAREHKGVVNGIYVSAYYLSGGLGSWVPFYIYENHGWNVTLAILTLVLATSAILILKMSGQNKDN